MTTCADCGYEARGLLLKHRCEEGSRRVANEAIEDYVAERLLADQLAAAMRFYADVFQYLKARDTKTKELLLESVILDNGKRARTALAAYDRARGARLPDVQGQGAARKEAK